MSDTSSDRTTVSALPLSKTASSHFTPGSEAHKQAFCAVLVDTFNPYKPSVLAWPTLSEDAKSRLVNLPFWDVAVVTEGYASSRMQAMADTLQEPLIKEAVALNAFEEGRHKLVLRIMLNFYDIPLKPETPYRNSQRPQWNFLCTGYGECFDSFFAFGLFKLAKDSGYFPPELVDVFEPIVQEEARHIMFFVNWVAYTAANKTWFLRIWFHLCCLAALSMAAIDRLSLTKAADDPKAQTNFVATGGTTLVVNLTAHKLIEVSLAEDKRRMASFDQRLLRPTIMPFLGRLALKFLSLFAP